MWDYRFLFSGVNTLLARSEELVGEHNEFTQAKLSPLTLKIMLQLMEAGILKGSQQDMHDLCLNIWLVTRYWFDFDAAMRGQGKLLPDSKKLGVLRNFSLIRPYVAEAHLAEFNEVIAGRGICNHERLGAKRKAWEEGAWVREAALAHAQKQHSRDAA